MTSTGLDRLGIGFWPGTPISDTIRTAKLADEAGIDSLWLPESTLGPGRDSISIMGALATATRRVKLASGIISIFTRTPTLIASTVATLDELSDKRMVLGLGTGHREPLANFHSVRFEHPLTRMREYVEVIRKILSGETVNYNGTIVSIKGFKLGMEPPHSHIPIYIAAVGPGMANLAGLAGDGILITMNTPPQLKTLIGYTAEGSKSPGRSEFDTAAYVLSLVSEDDEANLKAARRVIATYCSAPFYNKVFANAGYVDEARQIAGRWHSGDKDGAMGIVSEKMIRDFAGLGVEEALKMAEKYRKVGVKLPVLSLVYTPGFDRSVTKLFRELPLRERSEQLLARS